jgi:hypothetical protein
MCINSKNSNCKYTIRLTQNYVDGKSLSIIGGDTICIQAGIRLSLKLVNFHGSPTNYIVFKNTGGVVIVKNDSLPYGIAIDNSSYFRLTGAGSSTDKYGIKVMGKKEGASGLAVGNLSTNFEVDHMEIANTGFAGIFSKTDPLCDLSSNRDSFTQYQSIYHDNYIHNTGGEGMYIGHSFYSGWTTTCSGQPTVLYPSVLKGVRIYNNIVDSAGWDGIQVGSATEDCKIYGNTITNYGIASQNSQNSGIQIGGGTTGSCFNNAIMNGSGNGITVFGLGNNFIYNNVIVNAGSLNSKMGDLSSINGIFCDDRSTIPYLSFNLINNTIISPMSDGIRIYSNQSRNNKIYNNLILNPGSYGNYQNILQSYIFYNSDVDVNISNNFFSQILLPLFRADSLNTIYKLTSNLPINFMGKDVSLLGIDHDYFNNPRPKGENPDIGAFQFNINKSFIPNHNDSAIFIYPNPNNGEFSIINKGKETIKKIALLTVNGKNLFEKHSIYSSNIIPFFLPNMINKGIYILQIETEIRKCYLKLVVR